MARVPGGTLTVDPAHHSSSASCAATAVSSSAAPAAHHRRKLVAHRTTSIRGTPCSADGSLPNTSLVHIAAGAAFVLDGTRSHDDEVIKGYRLSPLATIEMDGGELSVVPNRAPDPGEQVLGPLHLLDGAARVRTFNWTQVSGPFKLTVNSLDHEAGATLYVQLQPGDEDPAMIVVNPPTMTNGIIGAWVRPARAGSTLAGRRPGDLRQRNPPAHHLQR